MGGEEAIDDIDAGQAVAARRRLLQTTSDTAAVVQVQMTGASENATAALAQELGSVVANNALEVSSLPLFESGITDQARMCWQKSAIPYKLRTTTCRL